MAEARSSLAVKIINTNPRAYEALVVEGGTTDLARELLERIKPDQLHASPVAANAMLAGLWLWHDALEESHSLSQKLDSPDGSYWHAKVQPIRRSASAFHHGTSATTFSSVAASTRSECLNRSRSIAINMLRENLMCH